MISDPGEFLRCKERWNQLAAESDVRHPFVSHGWLTTWWECFGAGRQLQVFVVKSGEEWIGAAPMMIHTVRMYGIPVRRLDSIYNFHSPRNEFLFKERRDDVYALLWEAMSSAAAPWDVIVLQQFLSHSPTLTHFQTMAESSDWRTGEWTAPASPYIRLGCPFDDVLKRLNNNMRQNLRRRHAKLSGIDVVDIETVSDPGEVSTAMQDGLRIEAAAWKGAAGTAIISDPQVERFYTRLAARTAMRGRLKLIFLRLGGKRIAFHYMLETDGVLYGLKTGYDPDYQAYSPGNMLRSLLLKDACARGCSEYDLLGSPDAWKLAWTKETRPHNWLYLFRNRPVARFVYHAKFNVLPPVRSYARLMKAALQGPGKVGEA